MKHVEKDGIMIMEPSDHWRLICEELEAISTNPEHFSILTNFNEGKGKHLIRDRELMKEFVDSYPGLV